ncbi:MAG: SCP2 sterol-binding domain-containing protein [Actinomycetota bacterium]|nr:SCP2 sterol-binding domain-containing protein [Actinomycetota bacterium]
MVKYPFLSDEWVTAARQIRAEFNHVRQTVTSPVRMNQVITDVPFGEGTVDAHLDTSSGELVLETGHLEGPDVTVTLDYETAKAVFVNGTPQAGMQAFMAGKVKVEGDMAKLLAAMQAQVDPPNSEAVELARRIQAITE